MAQIISNNPNVSVTSPPLTGGFIPSIDNPQRRNGLGTIVPWGGGTSLQTQVSAGAAIGVSTESQTEISQLRDLILSRPTGDTINYVLEGIVGPPGPPGSPGPAGLPGISGTVGAPGVDGEGGEGTNIDVPLTSGITFSNGAAEVVGEWDSYTKLVLHCNASPFTDEMGKTVTNTNVTLDTTNKVFGAGSASFDGTAYLTLADSDDWNFGTGNFTIDFRVIFSSLPSPSGIMGLVAQSDMTANSWAIVLINTSGTYYLRFYTYQFSWQIQMEREVSVSINTPYHVALTRNGNDFRFFLNGTQCGTTFTDARESTSVAGYLYIGSDSANPLSGNMDEVRISKGIARWTTDFTPSTSEYTATGSSPETYVSWSTGTLRYKGVDYTITAGENSSEHLFIYWDEDSTPTSFLTTDSIATATGGDKWVMCYAEDKTAYPAYGSKIIHGGLIQAGTITTGHLAASSITAEKMAVDSISANNIVANSITTVKLNDLNVTTGKIAANAATGLVSAYTAGTISCSSGLTEVQSATLTTTGAPVQIDASCLVYVYGTGAYRYTLSSSDSGTLFDSDYLPGNGGAGTWASISVSRVDTGASGSCTWTLSVHNGSDVVKCRQLVASEIKK